MGTSTSVHWNLLTDDTPVSVRVWPQPGEPDLLHLTSECDDTRIDYTGTRETLDRLLGRMVAALDEAVIDPPYRPELVRCETGPAPVEWTDGDSDVRPIAGSVANGDGSWTHPGYGEPLEEVDAIELGGES